MFNPEEEVGGGVEAGECLALSARLHLRADLGREALAELHAPLVPPVHVPEETLSVKSEGGLSQGVITGAPGVMKGNG